MTGRMVATTPRLNVLRETIGILHKLPSQIRDAGHGNSAVFSREPYPARYKSVCSGSAPSVKIVS
jgi:hypothetical protein